MAFVEKFTLSPLYWSIWLIIGIISTIVVSFIAQSEHKKRRWKSDFLASDHLKITSALSIVSGLGTSIGLCLTSMPGVCLFSSTVVELTVCFQFLFLGLYQLSRLHYSFSKTSARHANGYPKLVFILMVTVGITLTVSWTTLFTLGAPLPSKCGFKTDLSFEWHYKDRDILFGGNMDEQIEQFSQYFAVITGIASMWDITTLLLYSYKIRSFRKTTAFSQDAVWRNIMFILQRIIILTLFYQITLVMCLLIIVFVGDSSDNDYGLGETVLHIGTALLTMLYTISMYLMMEHNTNEYLQFLHCFKKSGLKYVYFCCWHGVVDRQLADFEEMKTKMPEETPRQNTTSSTQIDNASRNVKFSGHADGGRSIPTITVVQEELE